jgi:5'-nucleotidase
MLDRVRDQGIQIAIQNGGGLRASIDAGEVSMGEVLTVLPFQNTLATFQLEGEDVLAALENGVSQIEEGAGRFPQVAGLKYTFDASAEPGARVSDVMVMTDGAWQPLDPEATYGVVSNNFMRRGGDGYSMFAADAMNAYDFGPGLEQVVADYLAENSPYTPYTDGRITAK